VVQKEALYCALGRCALRLKDVIPFDQWLDHTLSVEAQDTNPKYVITVFMSAMWYSAVPSYPIIKRRIAWLIGKWVSESCASPNNPRIWEILTHLLKDRGPGTDSVVRLTAVVALKECLDVWKISQNFVTYNALKTFADARVSTRYLCSIPPHCSIRAHSID
jgi:hypothetical protein